MSNKIMRFNSRLMMRKFRRISSGIFLLLVLVSGHSFAESRDLPSKVDVERLKINVHLYGIFCESSKHPFRTEACQKLFTTILTSLADSGYEYSGRGYSEEQIKELVRIYKRIYEVID